MLVLTKMTKFRSLVSAGNASAIRALLVLAICSLTATYARAQGFSCNPPMTNAIVCENSKPGNSSTEWDVSGSGDSTIQGFATDISVNQGQTVHFKVNTTALAYRIDIYRMGYYGGAGARKIASVPSPGLPQSQPVCLSDQATALVDCGNWAESASWAVPQDATSGIYFARLVRSDTGGASHIFFVVRADSANSAILLKTSDTTWQAYNTYGGNSLYSTMSPTGPGRAYKVSYNRPFLTRDGSNNPSWVFNAEYPMVRWLEANGYDVSYVSSIDADRSGSSLPNHRLVLSVGHDEYWSANERASFEAARAAGVHLGFFSGNEMFWKVRWENSVDGSFTPYRTLVCYKETQANAPIDPEDPPIWTGTWRDPRFSPPADGGRPENALSGTTFYVNGWRRDSISVPAAYGPLRFWRSTSIATLAPGATYTFPVGTLGMEWDQDVDNGFRPAGLIDMSSTSVDVSDTGYLKDYGSVYGSGVATHNLTLYRASSGALVFGAGTVQWPWGLDSNHDNATTNSNTPPDPNMQQATVNLFADMGIQPATLQPGLVAATASTDFAPPTSTITSPMTGSSVQPGSAVTITGGATDSGGGVVAAVEVSIDGGASWHRASGLNTWTYMWAPSSSGQVTLKSRAVDDSMNMEIPSAGVTVTVGAATLSSLSLSPSAVAGGNSSTGTVTLNGPAPVGGTNVALASDNTSAASVPAGGVTIPAGATSATFTVTTSPVVFSNRVTITASYNSTTQTATLTVLSPVPML
jgi:hypothetical protein